jgi:hypothetical protein
MLATVITATDQLVDQLHDLNAEESALVESELGVSPFLSFC